MIDTGSDIDNLIYDIKQGNVQNISWEILLKLIALLAKEHEESNIDNDLK